MFDVGESDGVQYYAMQLITGSPVHLVIKEVDKLRKSGQTDLDEGELSTQSSHSLSTNSVPPTPGSTQNVAGATVSTTIIDPASTAGSAKERQTYYLKVARIGKQVAQALEYAHQHGVIHRDIKPSNLIVDIEGNPWVTDFGLAKTDDDGLTQTGNVVGTLRYIAPERFDGQCDERSDIYSLGMTLYEMVALKPAFETSNQIQLLQKIKDTEPPRLKTFDPKIPRDIQTIISRAINKDPRHRYQSAEALAKDLTLFLDDQPITARFVPAWEKLWFWARKHKQLATALVAISSLMMAGIVASVLAANYYFKKERQQQLLANANENLAIEMEVQRDGAFCNAYLADMRAAHDDLLAGNTFRMLQTLQLYMPKDGRPDVRNWEWYYLLSQVNSDALTIEGHDDVVTDCKICPLGKWIASAARDGSLQLHDATSGKQKFRQNVPGVHSQVGLSSRQATFWPPSVTIPLCEFGQFRTVNWYVLFDLGYRHIYQSTGVTTGSKSLFPRTNGNQSFFWSTPKPVCELTHFKTPVDQRH